jgi:hypothetical protein
MRVLLEKRVHRFISKDNDKLIEASVVHSLRRKREKEAQRQGADTEKSGGGASPS